MAATSEPNGLSRVERELWVSLKYHLEALSGERQKLTEQQFKAHGEHHKLLAENIRTALSAMDRRLDGMNEFRASLEDITSQSVRRDLFDIVANRLTVVENTYLTRADYAADNRAEEKRDIEATRLREAAYKADHDQIAEKVSALERTIIGRELFGSLAEKVAVLEGSVVTQTALDAQRNEAERSRRAFTYGLVTVGAAAIINFAINIYQGARGAG